MSAIALTVVNQGAAYPALTGTPSTPAVCDPSLCIAETGFALRGICENTKVRVQRRTLETGAWATIGEQTGTDPAVYWGLDGRAYCVYRVGADAIRLRDVEAGTETTMATGTHPRVANARNGARKCLTYWRSNTLYARVYDGQGNDLYGENAAVSSVAEGAMDIDFRRDGTLEGVYSTGGTVTTVTSPEGKVWT